MFRGRERSPRPGDHRDVRAGCLVPGRPRFGPDGRLYYVDVATGTIRRIDFTSGNQPPIAVATGLADERARSADRELHRLGLERSRRHDRLLRVGPRRGRPVRRLDGREPDVPVHRPPGRCTVRLRVTDNSGAEDVSDPITITAGSNPPTAVHRHARAVVHVAGGRRDLVLGSRNGSRGRNAPRVARCAGTSHCSTALARQLPQPSGAVVQRRRERVVQRARSRVPVVPPADAHRHGLVRHQRQRDDRPQSEDRDGADGDEPLRSQPGRQQHELTRRRSR